MRGNGSEIGWDAVIFPKNEPAKVDLSGVARHHQKVEESASNLEIDGYPIRPTILYRSKLERAILEVRLKKPINLGLRPEPGSGRTGKAGAFAARQG